MLDDKIYRQIELKRKLKIENEIKNLLNSRVLERENIIHEIKKHNENIRKQKELEISQAVEREKAISIQNENIRMQNELENKNTNITTINVQTTNVEQIIENENTVKTNIPFSQDLIDKYLKLESIKNIENNNRKSEVTDIKRVVNKRLMQVSSDIDHITDLANDLQRYNNGSAFIEAFSCKMIEQSKLQVSGVNESHKSLSFLFYKMYSQDLFDYYRYKVFCDHSIDNKELSNVYLVYFCTLKAIKNYDEAWFFLASLLNVKPIESTLYVLDSFLKIFIKEMKQFYGSEYSKLVAFLTSDFIVQVDNEPIKYRITSMLNE